MGTLLTIIGWGLGLAVLALAVFFIIGPQRIWEMLVGDPDTGTLALADVRRSSKPNDGFIAPSANAQVAADRASPVFGVPAEQLFQQLISTIDQEQHMTWRERSPDQLYARALTYSPLMKFPDVNHVWVLPVGENQSTVALYAVAQLGHSDLGKNLERLETWLEKLDQHGHQEP